MYRKGINPGIRVVDAAVEELRSLANGLTWEDLNPAHDDKLPNDVRYKAIRLMRQVEGLQGVIVINGGVVPNSWLPMLYQRGKVLEFKSKN